MSHSLADTPPVTGRPLRRYERYNTTIDVTVTSGHTFWTGLTSNISTGGLFLASETPLPVGSLLAFELRVDEGEPCELRGVVRWVREPEQASDAFPAGMGVQFSRLDGPTAEVIEQFIRERRDSLYFDTDDDP